jgi:WD40 repeat protein
MEETQRLRGGAKSPRALAWSRDGQLAVGYRDGQITIWPPKLESPPRIVAGSSEAVKLAFTHDSSRIVLLSSNDRISLLDSAQPDQSTSLDNRTHVSPARALVLHPAQELLFVSYDGGQISAWDLTTRTMETSLPIIDPIAALGLDVSPDGRFLASTGGDQTVKIYDLKSGKLFVRPKLTLEGKGQETAGKVAFSIDGAFLAALGSDNLVYIWELVENEFRPFVVGGTEGNLSTRVRGEKASGEYSADIAWVGDHELVVLTADGAIRVINLDVAGWHTRQSELYFKTDAATHP